jgi:hypothetical protein
MEHITDLRSLSFRNSVTLHDQFNRHVLDFFFGPGPVIKGCLHGWPGTKERKEPFHSQRFHPLLSWHTQGALQARVSGLGRELKGPASREWSTGPASPWSLAPRLEFTFLQLAFLHVMCPSSSLPPQGPWKL